METDDDLKYLECIQVMCPSVWALIDTVKSYMCGDFPPVNVLTGCHPNCLYPSI